MFPIFRGSGKSPHTEWFMEDDTWVWSIDISHLRDSWVNFVVSGCFIGVQLLLTNSAVTFTPESEMWWHIFHILMGEYTGKIGVQLFTGSHWVFVPSLALMSPILGSLFNLEMWYPQKVLGLDFTFWARSFWNSLHSWRANLESYFSTWHALMWCASLFVDLYCFQSLRFFLLIARASWFIQIWSQVITKIPLHSYGLVPTNSVLLGGWSSSNVVWISYPF